MECIKPHFELTLFEYINTCLEEEAHSRHGGKLHPFLCLVSFSLSTFMHGILTLEEHATVVSEPGIQGLSFEEKQGRALYF